MTPEIERKVWNTVYGPMLSVKKKKPPPLQVGDRVRLTTKHRLFKKGYLPRWTEEVFVVARVIPSLPGTVVTYRIKEWDDTLLEGTFYREDLQKVEVKDDDLFRIEKVLKRKGDRVLVRWKNWPSKYDSWLEKKALVPLGKHKKEETTPKSDNKRVKRH